MSPRITSSGTRSRTSSPRSSSTAAHPRSSRRSGCARREWPRDCAPFGSGDASGSTHGATTCSGGSSRNRSDQARRAAGERTQAPRQVPQGARQRRRYGVFAEFRQLPGPATVEGFGLYPFTARVTSPEEPGEFCFPPLAATITGAGRLLLALAQADVEAGGGCYVACDTDSLVIVSTRVGGLVACPEDRNDWRMGPLRSGRCHGPMSMRSGRPSTGSIRRP